MERNGVERNETDERPEMTDLMLDLLDGPRAGARCVAVNRRRPRLGYYQLPEWIALTNTRATRPRMQKPDASSPLDGGRALRWGRPLRAPRSASSAVPTSAAARRAPVGRSFASAGLLIILRAVTFSIDFGQFVPYNPFGAWSTLPRTFRCGVFVFGYVGWVFSGASSPRCINGAFSRRRTQHQGAGET